MKQSLVPTLRSAFQRYILPIVWSCVLRNVQFYGVKIQLNCIKLGRNERVPVLRSALRHCILLSLKKFANLWR
jgi:hypothetical protein